MLNLWRRLSATPLFARLLSVLCVVAALRVMQRLVRRHVPELPAALLLLPLAVHPYVLYQASEVRCYGLAMLLSALQCGLLADLYLSSPDTGRAEEPPLLPRRWWAYVLHALLAAACLYTQYYLGFLLAAGGAVLLALRRWRALGLYLAVMVGAALLFVPGALVVLEQFSSHTEGLPPERGLGAVRWVYWRVADYLVPLRGVGLAGARAWLLRGLLVGLAGLALWGRKRLLKPPLPALAAGVVALLGAHLLLLHVVSHEVVQQRHTVFYFLPLQLALLVAVATLGGRRLLLAVALVLTLVNAAGTFGRLGRLAKTGDWARVAAYLEAHERPGEPVLVFVPDGVYPFEWHYGGCNRLIPVPRPVSLRRYDPAARVLSGTAPLAAALAEVAEPGGTFWLVDDEAKRDLSVVYRREQLEAFFTSCCVAEERVELFGNTVSRLRLVRRPPPEGEPAASTVTPKKGLTP